MQIGIERQDVNIHVGKYNRSCIENVPLIYMWIWIYSKRQKDWDYLWLSLTICLEMRMFWKKIVFHHSDFSKSHAECSFDILISISSHFDMVWVKISCLVLFSSSFLADSKPHNQVLNNTIILLMNW